jgi:excisionase family DNA binding protein
MDTTGRSTLEKIDTLARCSNVSSKTLRRAIARGELEAVRVGKRAVRVPADAFAAYLAARRVSAA